jgi:ATP-dependent Zn protease
MSNLTKNILWAILTLIVISLLFSFFVNPPASPQTLSLNQLVDKINAGQVTKVVVNGNDLAVTQKDGSTAVSKKESELGISETLKNLGVNPTALQGVDLEVQEQSGWQFWAGILIPTLLPLIAIGFFSGSCSARRARA